MKHLRTSLALSSTPTAPAVRVADAAGITLAAIARADDSKCSLILPNLVGRVANVGRR
jgi:hypothetical protein